MRRPLVYLSHPYTHRNPARTIETKLKWAGFDVFNPFNSPLDREWRIRPSTRLAGRIIKKEIDALAKSDAVFVWLPKPSVGTCMEIALATVHFRKPTYIVTRIFHAWLVALDNCHPTVDGAIRAMATAFSQKKPLKAAKSTNTPAQTRKKSNIGGVYGGVDERGVQELIAETWSLIDKAKARLAAANVSEREKISWAGVLANAIGTLNRLLWKTGANKVDEEDLASILSKVPDKYVKMVKRKLKVTEKPDFKGISQGDLVEIVWLDASLSHGIIKVTNRTIATYKRTCGRFVGIFKDRQYGHPHVLIQHEFDEGGTSDVSSIPLGIVVGVKKLAEREALKKLRNGASVSWTSPLEGGGLKIVTRKMRK